MRRLILLANLVLVLLLVFLSRQVISDWRGFESRNDIAEAAKVATGSTAEVEIPLLEFGSEAPSLPFPDFLVVADRNLFSPERRLEGDEPEVAAAVAQVPQPPPLPVKPALNGVLTLRGEKQAFLTVFSGNNSQGQPRTVRLNEMVEGYRVSEITETTVTLSWNDHHVPIDRDSAPRPQRERAARAAPAVNIIKIGTAVAAVETTTPDAAAVDERRGVEVGVVGASTAAQPAARMGQRTPAPPNTTPGGARMRGGAAGANTQQLNQAGFGTVGIPPGSGDQR